MQDRWLPLQLNRVILAIFARGLLSKRQEQIVWAVISDSWAHWRKGEAPGLSNRTREPMSLTKIQAITGVNRAHASTELRGMVERGIVCVCSDIRDRQIRLSFNEHFTTWGLPKQQRGYRNGNTPGVTEMVTGGLPKRQHFDTEMVAPLNVRARAFSPLSPKRTPKEECATPHSQVYHVLNSIDAKGYRNLAPYPALERDLEAQVRRLGLDRVVREAESLRTWLEAKFAAGQFKRDSRHLPQQRFIRWLRKCEPGDNSNGPHRETKQQAIDRLTRMAGMARPARSVSP